LRALREQLGLTLRDVENASLRIAQRHGRDDFAIQLSRLSDIETKGVVPSIYRLYSLAAIYRSDFLELLSWFGVGLNGIASDLPSSTPSKTHISQAVAGVSSVRVPVSLDPSFDLRRTTSLGRMIERWGVVPLAYLQQFTSPSYSYGYIGSEDLTMWPLIMPGSFVQIDESRNTVTEAEWRSEYERPIYFVETREGYTCCWCALRGGNLILQPHPLSPVPPRVLKGDHDAELVGQVVGLAMRLGDWRPVAPDRGAKG
jgi:transcriptional regulator with XRE-family HTH domain